jgi:hypothetical protein
MLRTFRLTPPANVEVAVDVANIAATLGVEVDLTTPVPSVESNIFAPRFES